MASRRVRQILRNKKLEFERRVEENRKAAKKTQKKTTNKETKETPKKEK